MPKKDLNTNLKITDNTLTDYLKNNKWKNFCHENGYPGYSTWDLTLNSECYAYIVAKNDGYVYGEDCPDVRMPVEDYFTDLFFEDEEKLIEYLKSKNICEKCNRSGASRNMQNTCYENDDDNWAVLCDECQSEQDEYWDYMWKEYYSSRI